MLATKPHKFLSLFLIFVVCLSLVNVDVALADDSTPTETPVVTEPVTEPPLVIDVATEPPAATEAPTEVPTEATVEPAELPTEATPSPEGEPAPTDTTEPAPSEEPIAIEAPILTLVPEDTSVVVLDEAGEPVSLATQDAAEALVVADPIWCPAGVATPLAGVNGCSGSYASITELLDAMRTTPSAFDENGTIYLERTVNFSTPLILDDSAGSLAGSYATLSAYNLTVQGGWNPINGALSGHTDFVSQGGNEGYLLIGSAANPWIGSITLNDLTFTDISVANSITVYTSSGNITLNDVGVDAQNGNFHTGYLSSTSGNITIQDSSYFDGATGTGRNQGFYAETDTGSITVIGTGISRTFQDARGTNPANYNGATLSAPVVTLTNVLSQDNDGNGIEILNANVVTLNNVTSGATGAGQQNGLSGVLINGTGSTLVTINGGSFNQNGRYGLEILSASGITIASNPSYSLNTLGNLYENGAPNTSITSGPAAITNSTSASFVFNGSDNLTPPSLAFQCSLDGSAFAACTSPAGYTGLAQGSHNFQVRASDASGNVDGSPASYSWIVDTTAPTLNLPGNQSFEGNATGGYSGAYTGATATDAVDPAPSVSCIPASPNFFPLGNTTVTCTATDAAGNSSNGSFTVTVEDTTDPTLSLPGNQSFEGNAIGGYNGAYTGATATDVVDASPTVTCLPASPGFFLLGVTTVTCTATDAAGNSSNDSFTVTVVDTTDPVLTLPGTITAMATGPSGATVTYSTSANDIVAGSITPICSPASGSAFPVGTNTVNCSATDSSGNTASGSFLINVQDPDAPILSLPADITVEATGPAGAVVTFSVSANDAVDGNVPVTCTAASGSTFPLATTTVNCSATDSSGNSNSASFQVTVEDTTAPSIAAHLDITVGTNDPAIAVTYSSPATSDAVDGAGVATCTPASGSSFAFGDTTVTCTATDSSGNSATRTFVVHVVKPASVPAPGTTSTASEFIVPITGGGLVHLDCNSIFWLLGIRVGFLNLCDYQATLNDVEASGLPGSLPGGHTFVSGLDVDVLQSGEPVKDLPDGAGVRMDFPISNNANAQYAVLYWSDDDGDGNGQWLEVSQQITEDKLAATLVANPADELYRVTQDPKQNASTFYSTLTTDKTGIFVLVSK